VHGRIEQRERPADAAFRELREDTGLACERLYSITVNPFYLQATGSVELAIVFAAVVAPDSTPVLSSEHDEWEWLTPVHAKERLAWPREREALAHALVLLSHGDAGHLEDVLRVT
jgi:dATP pyrophosphohydrolase